MKKDNQKENAKNTILQVAIKLFAHKGYDAVAVQEICIESKITKPTLYYYFESKNGLLEAIVKEKGFPFLQGITEAISSSQGFISSLTSVIKNIISFAKNEPDFFVFFTKSKMQSEATEVGEVFSKIVAPMNKLFKELFVNGCSEFGNMEKKETLYSILFFNNVLSVATCVLQGIILPTDEVLHQIIHSFLYGVAS